MKNHYLLAVLAGALSLLPAGRARAQTFTTLYSFTNGSDGASPQAGLILSANTLYGTAYYGGLGSNGTVFEVSTDGAGFATLYSFTNGSDGNNPTTGLILAGNTLYGTDEGGAGTAGTVFKVNADGTGFATLHSFTNNSDGAVPWAGVILSGNTLYGTTQYGGAVGVGAVFKLNTDGTGFATLYSFGRGSDGGFPAAGLILSGNTLYGTTQFGGASGVGNVFEVNTDGTDFATLYSFTNGSDGYNPGRLILSGETLYGTASSGGTGGGGTVFKVNTDGAGFVTLYSFTNGSDGRLPASAVILSGNTLYGTTLVGGTGGDGTVFQVNTDGTGFATLYSFTARTGISGLHGTGINSDGAGPGGLILSGDTLYGTAGLGGGSGDGTVFSLSLPLPQLAIIQSGTDVVLSWPANATGFTLQSTTNLVSPAVWTPVSPAPVVVNGQNTVTTPISGTPQFYQLRQY